MSEPHMTRHEMIPDAWIKHYVDLLLNASGKLEPGLFRDAILLRAEHAIELVRAYRERVADWRYEEEHPK